MKSKLILLLSSFGIMASTALPVRAEEAPAQQPDLNKAIAQLTQETQSLEDQVSSLKAQLAALKTQQQKPAAKAASSTAQSTPAKTTVPQTSTHVSPHKQDNVAHPVVISQHKEVSDELSQAEGLSQTDPQSIHEHQKNTQNDLTQGVIYIAGTPVVTSPYVGVQSQYDGSNLIVNTSSVNKDLALLQRRDEAVKKILSDKDPLPTSPIIELSGKVEGTGDYIRGYRHEDSSELNLSAAELDVLGFINPWLTTFLSVAYDSSPPGPDAGVVTRRDNSNVYLDKAFFTIGNLMKSPVYFTMGQTYAPFGQYNSMMVSDSFDKSIGRTKMRGAVLGYKTTSDNAWNLSTYAFQGDTKIGGSSSSRNNDINQWGANLSYRHQGDGWIGDLGSSFISNIAESDGMQENGISGTDVFEGFGHNSASERMKYRVPGIDLRGDIKTGPWVFQSEYSGAAKAFSKEDMLYRDSGARPSALNVETDYNFNMWNKPSAFGVSYQRSWQAVALNLPEQRYLATLITSPWKSTTLAMEYHHSINYGNGVANSSMSGSQISALNHTEDALIAQFDVYF